MNREKLHAKLIRAARATPPDERMPYAFEQRVMAHLRSSNQLDPASAWVGSFWKSAMACAGIAMLACAWTLLPVQGQDTSLADDLDATVVASLPEDAAL